MPEMKELVNLVSTLSLWLFLVVVLLPTLPILLVVTLARQIEAKTYQVFYNATVFNSEDILWMLDSEKNRFVINGVLILAGEINIEALKRKVLLSLADTKNGKDKGSYSKATQHVISGYINYYWVEDEGKFNINDHVYKPFDILIKSEKDVQDLVSKRCNQAFNDNILCDNKSPWEMIVLPFLDGGVIKTALHIRLSHAIADGSALAHYLLYRLSDGKICYQKTVRKFSEKQRKLLFFMGTLFLPLRYLKMIMQQSDKHALHCDDVTGVKRVVWSDSIELSLVKDVKNRFNVTVADVLLGCLTVSLNRYFQQHTMEIPSDFLILIPVDIRASGQEAKSFENQVATIPLKLPTATNNIFEAIQEVHQRTHVFKVSGEPFSNYIGWKISSYFLPQYIAKAFVYHFVNKTSAIASILNASEQTVSITEHEVEFIIFWPPQTGNEGLGISFCSYCGAIRLGLETDSALMEYPSELVSNFHSVYKDLQQMLEK